MTEEEFDRELHAMRDRRVSPIQVIKFIRAERGLSFEEAKDLFARHPAWAGVHKANERLHDQAEEAIRLLAADSRQSDDERS